MFETSTRWRHRRNRLLQSRRRKFLRSSSVLTPQHSVSVARPAFVALRTKWLLRCTTSFLFARAEVSYTNIIHDPLCLGCYHTMYYKGSKKSSLTCTDGRKLTNAGPGKKLDSTSYFRAASVSCGGCSRIASGRCDLPFVQLNGTSAVTVLFEIIQVYILILRNCWRAW